MTPTNIREYVDIKALVLLVKDLNVKDLTKEQRMTLECFLLIPFLHVSTGKEIIVLTKKDVLIKMRDKKLLLRIQTEFETIHVLLKKHTRTYQMLFTEYIENKEDDDFIFLGEKDIKYRYQSFNNMLKKGFPLPIRNNSENFTAFLSHPFKVLKRAIKDDSELVQLIPKQ